MWKFLRRKLPETVPLERQIEVLASCGIRLAEEVAPGALTLSLPRAEMEAKPYLHLLCVMGSEAEDPSQAGPSGYPSDEIWHFDTECIEDHGDYVAIAERLRTLAGGALPIGDIEDHVDVEAGGGRLALHRAGRPRPLEG